MINQTDYPKTIGIDKRNGMVLKEIYDCYDLCPTNGGIVLIYDNINSKDECSNIGGVIVNNSWPPDGQFLWCKPKLE